MQRLSQPSIHESIHFPVNLQVRNTAELHFFLLSRYLFNFFFSLSLDPIAFTCPFQPLGFVFSFSFFAFFPFPLVLFIDLFFLFLLQPTPRIDLHVDFIHYFNLYMQSLKPKPNSSRPTAGRIYYSNQSDNPTKRQSSAPLVPRLSRFGPLLAPGWPTILPRRFLSVFLWLQAREWVGVSVHFWSGLYPSFKSLFALCPRHFELLYTNSPLSHLHEPHLHEPNLN